MTRKSLSRHRHNVANYVVSTIYALIGRAVTRSQTSLGVRARFRVGYDVFRMYAVQISTNQIRALKITPGGGGGGGYIRDR